MRKTGSKVESEPTVQTIAEENADSEEATEETSVVENVESEESEES
jgi:hypothetical protein